MQGPDPRVGIVHATTVICSRCGKHAPGASAWDERFERTLWSLCYPCLGALVNIAWRVEWRRRWARDPVLEPDPMENG